MRGRSLPPCRFVEFLWLWNELHGLATPAFHKGVACWLEERYRSGGNEALLMAFRNAGKSTLVGLFCAWLLLVAADARILVVAADHALAVKMTRHVRQVLTRHPLTKRLRPSGESWACDRLTVRRPGVWRDPSLLARGITGNVTGSRADVVICDDVEVPNSCATSAKREALRERLDEVQYVLTPGGFRLFVGTPHSWDSIYVGAGQGARRAYLADVARLEIPLLDGRGCSQWPERFSQKRIAALRRRSGSYKFASQMLLKPQAPSVCRLDAGCLRRYDESLCYRECGGEGRLTLGDRRLVSASCWWDPAWGSRGRGDGSVVAVVYGDGEGELWLHAARWLNRVGDGGEGDDEDEASRQCRLVADFARAHMVPAVHLEVNGLGRFLPGLLRRALVEGGVSCAVVEEYSRRSKDERILEAFDVVLAARALHAHASLWETPFIAEMRDWRPGASMSDDGLDAVSGCLVSEPVRLRARAPPPRRAPSWRPSRQERAAFAFDV